MGKSKSIETRKHDDIHLYVLSSADRQIAARRTYVYSKSLQQLKYRYLANLFAIEEIGYFIFFNNSDVIPLSEALPNSIFIFDDVTTSRTR